VPDARAKERESDVEVPEIGQSQFVSSTATTTTADAKRETRKLRAIAAIEEEKRILTQFSSL
jgi:hypothetical protein